MKILFWSIIFLIISFASNAQEGYIFTKQQHEQIKKNLHDYRILIKEYDVMSNEFEKTKRDFEILKAVNDGLLADYLKLKNEHLELKNNNVQLLNLISENEHLKESLISSQNELKIKNKSLNLYKSRYEREMQKTRGDRLIASGFFGLMVGGAIAAVFYAIEENY